jgi:hypothetical protein
LQLPRTGTILDGTIGNKTPNTPQVQDFINFSGGNKVIIVSWHTTNFLLPTILPSTAQVSPKKKIEFKLGCKAS